jgi:hypothetical protein
MPVDFKAIVVGVIIPALVSTVVAAAMRRKSAGGASRRIAAAFACAAGFFTGFALLHPEDLNPADFWHRLPWLGAFAAALSSILSAIPLTSKANRAGRWMLHLVIALGAAWILVPAFPRMDPSRGMHIAVFGAGLFALTVLLDRLAERSSGAVLAGSMSLAALCGAALLAANVSLVFGALAGVAFAALAGCWVVALRHGDENSIRSAVPVYAVLVGGIMLAGALYARMLRVPCALVPAAPLALYICEIGPLKRLAGISALLARLLAVGLLLAAAFLLAAQAMSVE